MVAVLPEIATDIWIVSLGWTFGIETAELDWLVWKRSTSSPVGTPASEKLPEESVLALAAEPSTCTSMPDAGAPEVVTWPLIEAPVMALGVASGWVGVDEWLAPEQAAKVMMPAARAT